MKLSIWTKKEMVVSLRALANAIEATEEKERIDAHLRELESIARVAKYRHLSDSPQWLLH